MHATGTIVEEDLHCARCGYNLRGLPTAGRCPECGLYIGRTIRLALPRRLDPNWVRALRDGCWLLEMAALAVLVAGVWGAWPESARHRHWWGDDRALALLEALPLLTLPWVLCAMAVWKLTRRPRRGVGRRPWDPLRLPARAAAVVALLGPQMISVWSDWLYMHPENWNGSGGPIFDLGPVTLTIPDLLAVVVAAVTWLLFQRLRVLARLRVAAAGRRRAKVLAYLLPATILLTPLLVNLRDVIVGWEGCLRFAPMPGLGYAAFALSEICPVPDFTYQRRDTGAPLGPDLAWAVFLLVLAVMTVGMLEGFRRGFARSARGGTSLTWAPESQRRSRLRDLFHPEHVLLSIAVAVLLWWVRSQSLADATVLGSGPRQDVAAVAGGNLQFASFDNGGAPVPPGLVTTHTSPDSNQAFVLNEVVGARAHAALAPRFRPTIEQGVWPAFAAHNAKREAPGPDLLVPLWPYVLLPLLLAAFIPLWRRRRDRFPHAHPIRGLMPRTA